MKIFDTHAHYDDDAFDEDRMQLLDESFGAGKTVSNIANIGCDIESSRESVCLAERYDYMYAVVGVIPHHVGDMTEADLEELRRLAKESKKVVAIGEIGLDYHYDEPSKEKQFKWFSAQMELAKELGLPIVIHSRDAAQDTYELMKKAHAEEIGGVVHCYSYSEEMSREFLKMGFYFGIGGVVTFKNSKKLKRAVESIPISNIVLETDSPYLTPSPYRGERNNSGYLPYVVSEIARLKGMTEEEVAEITFENACRLYRLS
ncbi:MAG: TatD family hydrolase [Eubacterium sp.]|nr:TatD family hydrolase [Eubacterium sp.]